MRLRWALLSLLAALVAVGVACGGSSPDDGTSATDTVAAESASAPAPAPAAAEPSAGFGDATDDSDTANVIRGLVSDFYDEYNSYNVAGVLDFLEDTYREVRHKEISTNIGAFKLFGLTVGVSEESEPVQTTPGEWEMYVTLDTPLGERRTKMVFKEIGGEWKVTFVEKVE